MADQIKSITALDPRIIVTDKRLRPASAAGVAALQASIQEVGIMKDPVHVRKKRDGTFHLICGLHRITAAIAMDWTEVPVVAWNCTDNWARLMEIDDNIAGAELTPLDTAIFLAERKRVYEKMHPETKAGVAGAKARWDANDIVSFASSTAEKFGLSKRQIERIVAAGTALDHDAIRWLRDAPKPVTLKDLQIIAAADPTQRSQICIKLTNGKAKNAKAALKQLNALPGDEIRSAADLQYRALETAFSRANMSARRRFVEEHGATLKDLMSGVESASEPIPFVAKPRATG